MQVAGIELNNFIIMAIDIAGSADDGNTDNTVSKYKIKIDVSVCIDIDFYDRFRSLHFEYLS